MFDYKGYTEKELTELCSESDLQCYHGRSSLPFWTTEAYGFGKWLRKYALYPRKHPIYLYSDHSGPSFTNEIFEYDFQFAHAFGMLFHTPAVVTKWNETHKPKAYTLYSPFVFCRKALRMQAKPEARGTIAYPSHSLPDIDDVSDIEKYISDLRALPDEYQPVAVSLHYHDINKGRHRIFLDSGIPVYTAGTPHDYRFTERFYSILSNFKYSTSNFLGSYIFYSIEMGIPFFFHGDKPVFKKAIHNSEADFNFKAVGNSINSGDYIYNLFDGRQAHITQEQKRFVHNQLGLIHGTGRIKLAALMYSALIEVELKKFIRKVQNKIQRLVMSN